MDNMCLNDVYHVIQTQYTAALSIWLHPCRKIICPQALQNKFKVISHFLKIRGDIRKWRCTTVINNTGDKFVTGVNDTSGKYWEQYQTADTLKVLSSEMDPVEIRLNQ